MEQMIWHWIWYNMTGATSEAGSIHLSGAPEFTPFFCGVLVAQSSVFSIVFCRLLIALYSSSVGHCIVCFRLVITTIVAVTRGRSVVFSGFSGFLHQWNWQPRYNWNIVENGVKHHNLPSCDLITPLISSNVLVNQRQYTKDNQHLRFRNHNRDQEKN